LLLLYIGTHLPNGALSTSKSKFDEKIEASSAKMYFHYYGQLLHQQNMLQDYVRTGSTSELSCFAFLLSRIKFPLFFEMRMLTCKTCGFSVKNDIVNLTRNKIYHVNATVLMDIYKLFSRK